MIFISSNLWILISIFYFCRQYQFASAQQTPHSSSSLSNENKQFLILLNRLRHLSAAEQDYSFETSNEEKDEKPIRVNSNLNNLDNSNEMDKFKSRVFYKRGKAYVRLINKKGGYYNRPCLVNVISCYFFN